MSKARHAILKHSEVSYDLYEDGKPLVRFERASFRERLEILGRRSNWIGAILRLFLRAFPPSYALPLRLSVSPAERVGESRAVEYLSLRGYRLYIPVNVSDREFISYLNKSVYLFDSNR